MPVYDISLWDFLKYASKRAKTLDVFPLGERIEMIKRICDGLLYMHKVKSVPHRDIKPRFVYQKLILTQSVLLSVIRWRFFYSHFFFYSHIVKRSTATALETVFDVYSHGCRMV